MRVELMVLVLAIHNFLRAWLPSSQCRDLSVAIPIAIAIAIHNIPEASRYLYLSIMQRVIRRKPFGYLSPLDLPEPLDACGGIFDPRPLPQWNSRWA